MTARALLNTQWERKQRRELGGGDAKWDSKELARLASFISEGHSLVKEPFSRPVAIQLRPPGEGGVRGASSAHHDRAESEVSPAIGR